MALRAALYARQSVDEPRGIKQQLDDCQAEVERRGWTVVEAFADDDVSGSTDRGPQTQWAAMLKAFDAGLFDVLIVTDTDRLTRRLADVLEFRPPRRDMRIVVVRGGIDTAEDDFMLKQLVLLAEREVKLKTTRARRYSAERRKLGHPTAGKTPHGYRWVHAPDRDESGTRWVVDEDEAGDVRRIFDEFLAGGSMKQIARDLNDAGRRTRRGTRWHASTVRRTLLNPAYAALLAPAQPTGQHSLESIPLEDCGDGAWEPIIDRDQLVAARGKLIGTRPHHDGTARKWLLPGLAVCGVCRGPIRSARGETHPTARKDGSAAEQRRYHAYRCRDHGHFMRNGDILDELVAELCIRRLSRDDAVDLFAPAEGPDLATLHARREELQTRRAWVVEQVARLGATPDLQNAQTMVDELSAEIARVDAQIAQAMNRDPLAEAATGDDVRGWWQAATLARRRAVVEALMLVVIHPVGHGRRVRTLETAAETVTIEWR